MPIDYDALMATRVDDEVCEYTDKDALLYALAVGFGSNPLDRKELPYVFEGASLKTVPTLASMLLSSTFLDGCGWRYDRVLHSELRLDLYRPLPPAARLLTNRRVTAVHDRGPNRGAKIHIESEVRLAKDDTALLTLGNTHIKSSYFSSDFKNYSVGIVTSFHRWDIHLGYFYTEAEARYVFESNSVGSRTAIQINYAIY